MCRLGALVAILLALAVFLLIEFAIPAVALVLLASIGGMLARAVNDRHDCEGRVGLSLAWGLIWSSLYVGPVAAAVYAALIMVG